MPKSGDKFTVKLLNTHLKWGTYRYTSSREPIYGETYIPIPTKFAHKYNIFNSNKLGIDKLGVNIFEYFAFVNNKLHSTGMLKASGCSTAGDIYAKNLSGNGNLKILSPWIYYANICVGDYIEVLFTSSTQIQLRKI
ncbi:hypothetical protein BFG05_04005 [Campylobacter pinnipediorum subsp. pinnipediorum]|uniref:hypothetical protein n=1 Tax=Campylobacter pinnipediorum TaxID=1965231 RepID=UPI000995B5A7|nr:hypothetical protein [Campylobacter pinnipediorum]OPA77089.1 hypothetical protein BFG05_04005 [Campylobacter pinnipediorum subsp. pinnipediorum]